MSPEGAPAPIVGFSYDYMTDEPPTIQRIAETPRHSSPYQEPPKLRARAVPALLAPRPRLTSVPPISTTVAKMAKRYMPTTEEVTPPTSPARAEAPSATPSPVRCPGRGRGRGRWRAHSSETPSTPGVGTRSKTRQAEAASQAQATRALWPKKPDKSLLITRMTRDLRLQDPPEDRTRDEQRRIPTFKIDENQNEMRPPAAGIHSHHRDVFIIPPPCAGGGVVGTSTPVSTAPLGLIHHVDPLLAAQLREDPGSLAVRDTRLRVLSTIRIVRTGLVANSRHSNNGKRPCTPKGDSNTITYWNF